VLPVVDFVGDFGSVGPGNLALDTACGKAVERPAATAASAAIQTASWALASTRVMPLLSGMGLSAFRNFRTIESLNFIFQIGNGHKVTKGGIFPRKCRRDVGFAKCGWNIRFRGNRN